MLSTQPRSPGAIPKRFLWPLGLLVPLLPFMAFGLVEATGLGVFWWWGPFFLFAIMPVLDTLIGKDAENPPDSAMKYLEDDRFYRWCTYLFLPLQYASLVWACGMWASGDLSLVESLGLAFTVGTRQRHRHQHRARAGPQAQAGRALAVEGRARADGLRPLLHRAQPRPPRAGGDAGGPGQLAARGVASGASCRARSPARSCRRGSSSASAASARACRFWSLRNDILNAWAMTVVLFAVLTAVFGWVVLPFLLLQAVFGFQLLEVVNYLEHYGLLRQKREDGRYERTEPRHSWNSNNVSSNVLLYHLQRHSDHHANPLRRYQALRHFDEAPELPSGYATMILLAYFPPIWRRVMDPKVREHYRGDLSLANVYAPKRAQVRPMSARRATRCWTRSTGCCADRTWSKLSMGEVARRAGVSRQTLYNEFGGRTEFARGADRARGRAPAGRPRARDRRPPGRPARGDRGRAALLPGGGRATTGWSSRWWPRPTTGCSRSSPTRDAVMTAARRTGWRASWSATFPAVERAAARRLTEVVVRLGISHAALPSGSPGQTAPRPHDGPRAAPRRARRSQGTLTRGLGIVEPRT